MHTLTEVLLVPLYGLAFPHLSPVAEVVPFMEFRDRPPGYFLRGMKNVPHQVTTLHSLRIAGHLFQGTTEGNGNGDRLFTVSASKRSNISDS